MKLKEEAHESIGFTRAAKRSQMPLPGLWSFSRTNSPKLGVNINEISSRLVASLLLVEMPGAPSSFLLLVSIGVRSCLPYSIQSISKLEGSDDDDEESALLSSAICGRCSVVRGGHEKVWLQQKMFVHPSRNVASAT